MFDFFAILKVAVTIIGFSVVFLGIYQWRQERTPFWAGKKSWSAVFAGFLANFLDTLGLGSFGVVIASDSHLKFLDERKLAGTLNYHAILPSMVQSLIFLQIVEIDILTVISLVFATCVGAYVSSLLVKNVPQQGIRQIMGSAFLGTAAIVFANQMGLLPLGGEAISLRGSSLIIGCVGMFFAGWLPSVGVGYYAPVQAFLFFLGMSPLAAFPIMATASALQQPVTALAFLKRNNVERNLAITLTLSAVFGVFIAAPLLTAVDKSTLRWLLFTMMLYNSFNIWRAYFKVKKAKAIKASASH